jgi:hypothetical protein
MSSMDKQRGDQTVNSSLDSVISEIKDSFKRIGSKSRELILKLGNELTRTMRSEDICEEIKHILNEEIREGLISTRNIERYCLDNWKKKTKPKKQTENDKLSLSGQNKQLSPLLVATNGKEVPESRNIDVGYVQPKSNIDPEIEEIELEEIQSSHIKNIGLDNSYDNSKEQLEFEITIPFRIIRKHILDPLHRQIGAKKILIHGTIDNKTSRVISAWVTGILEDSESQGFSNDSDNNDDSDACYHQPRVS